MFNLRDKMAKLTKLELTWPGKENRLNPEPRILQEDKAKSYSADPKIQELKK